MELRQLRYFLALAEELNFTRAAQKMHITQSTLSHQIKQMEDELGQRLFDRIDKRVIITDAGAALLPNATRALREVDESLRMFRTAPDPLLGALTIGTTHTFNIRVIPDCLAAFLGAHPSVSVVVRELYTDDIARMIAAGELDVGIALGLHPNEEVDFEPLYVDEMVLAVAASHPFATRRRVRLAELHKQRLILPTATSSTRGIIDAALRDARAEPVVVAELDAVAATLELVRRTDLAAIVSRLAAPDTADMRTLALESPTLVRRPGILTRAGRPQSAALRSFIGILRRVAIHNRQLDAAVPPAEFSARRAPVAPRRRSRRPDPGRG
jgi:LysR family cyn operon transcriptional activator